jgi:hypothetical protein
VVKKLSVFFARSSNPLSSLEQEVRERKNISLRGLLIGGIQLWGTQIMLSIEVLIKSLPEEI